MNKNRIYLLGLMALFMAGCEHAKEFHYFIRNATDDELKVYVNYSISAKGTRNADTFNILPGDRERVLTHSGLGGFYTGAIEEIRFSGEDTLKQEWRNRSRAHINKHFFRRGSWQLVHQGDDREYYLFTVTSKDLKKSPQNAGY